MIIKAKRGELHNLRKLKDREVLHYKSLLERQFVLLLEASDKCDYYFYENIKIPYVFRGVQKNYIPDFLVKTRDDEYILIEVKPSNQVDYPLNKTKFQAAQKFVNKTSKNIKFRVLTEKFLSTQIYF